MDDHKWYFDPRDLWPMLVRAGFRRSQIRCHRHKFGLNTFAACRVRHDRRSRAMGEFADSYVDGDASRSSRRSTSTSIDRVADGLAARARPRRAAVRARRRRLGRSRLATP